jgi:hypothetical protein
VADNKITVETTGNFMLQDPFTGDVIEAYKPCEVENTAWVQGHIARGTLSTKETSKVDEQPEPAEQVPGVDTGAFSASTHDTKPRGSSQRNKVVTA